ncbi:MAG: hypothetical protein EXR73_12645, partial [Myxococcales bacterium]|nr:hypothetical protein [Myxococcales bacterium]
DDAASTLDLCGFGDEDCDASSPDGSEQASIGDACDGIDDADSCRDGARACITGVMTCVDVEDAHVVGLTLGNHHTCALTNVGSVYCWGRNQYGTSAAAPRTRPPPSHRVW